MLEQVYKFHEKNKIFREVYLLKIAIVKFNRTVFRISIFEGHVNIKNDTRFSGSGANVKLISTN